MKRRLGLDVGYGFVKVTDDSDGYLFPSVVGNGSIGSGFNLAPSAAPADPTDEICLSVDGRVYYVGQMAIRRSRLAYRGLSETRTEGNDMRVLVLAALSFFCHEPTNTFQLVTGLPPGRMHLADNLIQQFQGEHRIIRHGAHDQAFIIRIDRLQVVPQPLGSFWAQVLEPSGRVRSDHPLLSGRVGLLDVGFGTSDLAVVQDGEYVPEASRTIPTGLSTAYDDISEQLQVEHGIERQTYALDKDVLTEKIHVAGRQIDISRIVAGAFDNLSTKLLVEMKSVWQIAGLDRILLTGGGGQALGSKLLRHLPQGEVLDNAATANSRGYYAWAARAFQG
jgi:plasmid segregation protein ParM